MFVFSLSFQIYLAFTYFSRNVNSQVEGGGLFTLTTSDIFDLRNGLTKATSLSNTALVLR